MKKRYKKPLRNAHRYKKKIIQDVILLHKIDKNIFNHDIITEYNKILPKKFGNLNILNIILPSENINDIKVVYPDLNIIKPEIKDYLNIVQKRKLNIEILKQIL